MYLFNRLNLNSSSIVTSVTEQGAKFSRQKPLNTEFAESQRLFRVNSYYFELIMITPFITRVQHLRRVANSVFFET